MELLDVLVQAPTVELNIASLHSMLKEKGQGLVVKVVASNADDESAKDYIGKTGLLMEVHFSIHDKLNSYGIFHFSCVGILTI